ncbi:hypothetical protein Tco_1298934 [Tanacetum coccineum]
MPSSSSPPPSFLPSSSSPPPSLLPSSSRKRYRSPSPPPLPTLPPPPPVLPPPLERVESVEDDVETLRARLTSVEQVTVTLRARGESLEQHDVVTRDSLRITRGRITWLQLRAVYAKQETEDGVRTQRVVMTKHDVETLRARAEAIEQLEMAELRSRAQDIEASFLEIERHLGP